MLKLYEKIPRFSCLAPNTDVPRREIRLPCHLLIGSHVLCVEKLQLNEQKFELQQSLKAKYAFNII